MKIQKSQTTNKFEVQIFVQGQKYWDDEMTVNEYGHCVQTSKECYTPDKLFKKLELNELNFNKISDFIIDTFNYRKTAEEQKIEHIEFDTNVDDITNALMNNGEYIENISDVKVNVPVADRKRMYKNFIGQSWRDMKNVNVKAIKIIRKAP